MTRARRPRITSPAKVGVAAAGRDSLTPERIIDAALQELDERGLAAFSMRNVAARLGVYPTAIYWHVRSRDALLAGIVGRIVQLVEPAHGLPWQRYLRALFGSYRASIKRHPHASPLVGAHLIGNSSIPLSFVEGLLQKLSEAGFEGLTLVWAYNTVVAALVGFVTQEFATVPDERDAWRAEVRGRLSRGNLSSYPVLRDNLKLLANKAFVLRWQSGAQSALDQSFDLYVDVIVAGLERMAKPPR